MEEFDLGTEFDSSESMDDINLDSVDENFDVDVTSDLSDGSDLLSETSEIETLDLEPIESEFELEEISDDTLNIDDVPYESTEFDTVDELETSGVSEIDDEVPEVLSFEEDGISEIDFDANDSSETDIEEFSDVIDESNDEAFEELTFQDDEVSEIELEDSATSDTDVEELSDVIEDSNDEVTDNVSLPENDEVLETDIYSDGTTSDMESETYVREYDDFETSVLSENPEFYETGQFYQQGINEYGYQGTCGETSQANAINTLLGNNELTENKVLDIAVDNNLCEISEDISNSGGTTTSNFMELYDKVNESIGDKIDVDLYEYDNALSPEEMADRIENGSVLNVAVDSATLWGENDHIPGQLASDTYTDHWITVTGVSRDAEGNIDKFDIIDSGGGVDSVDYETYERMCFGEDGREMIDPTCIVVSKKDIEQEVIE